MNCRLRGIAGEEYSEEYSAEYSEEYREVDGMHFKVFGELYIHKGWGRVSQGVSFKAHFQVYFYVYHQV